MKWALLVLTMMFLSACNFEQEASTELCGYGPMMVVNDKEYLRVLEKKPFKLEKELGVIEEKLEPEYHPVENFSSNVLEVGSTIFSVEGYDQYIIAKTEEDQYLLFEEIK